MCKQGLATGKNEMFNRRYTFDTSLNFLQGGIEGSESVALSCNPCLLLIGSIGSLTMETYQMSNITEHVLNICTYLYL